MITLDGLIDTDKVDRGFTEFGLQLIWGETMEHNQVARHVFEAVGLKIDGIRRYLYSQGRDEWKPS